MKETRINFLVGPFRNISGHHSTKVILALLEAPCAKSPSGMELELLAFSISREDRGPASKMALACPSGVGLRASFNEIRPLRL
jgi:hypothetical protein